jgi:hypothetical protein
MAPWYSLDNTVPISRLGMGGRRGTHPEVPPCFDEMASGVPEVDCGGAPGAGHAVWGAGVDGVLAQELSVVGEKEGHLGGGVEGLCEHVCGEGEGLLGVGCCWEEQQQQKEDQGVDEHSAATAWYAEV